MRLKVWVLVSLYVALSAATNDSPRSGCDYVGAWGEWSECREPAFPDGDVPETRPMTDKLKSLGKGRKAMARMKQYKLDASQARLDCAANSSCHRVERKSMPAADCIGGMAGGYPCRNVHLKAMLNFEALGYLSDLFPSAERSGNDIWGWRDPTDSHDYVIVGTSGGCSFVRITDPVNPQVLGFLPSQTVASLWRDMKVIKNHVYIGSEAAGHGLQVFDLTQLRSLTANNTRRFTATFHYNAVGRSHNIVGFDEADIVAIVGATEVQYNSMNCRGGLHLLDVKQPTNPKFLGCWGSDAYIHDAQCFVYPSTGPDVIYHGRHICLTFAEDSFTVVDITTPATPVSVSRVYYVGCFYSHQGWASEDLKMAVLDDELDERESLEKFTQTYVFDLTDLDNPVVVQRFTSTQTSIDHNQYIMDSYSHQSNYEAGYRLVEIDTNMKRILGEVAYFDVYPTSTSTAFEGTWSNYPYFNNGIVPVNSINDGLFLLEVDWAAINAQKGTKDAYTERQRFRDISGAAESCPSPVEVEKC